jgi:hypothetical protein
MDAHGFSPVLAPDHGGNRGKRRRDVKTRGQTKNDESKTDPGEGPHETKKEQGNPHGYCGQNEGLSMSEARRNKAGAELRNGESGRDKKKERPSLSVSDVEFLLHEGHQRRKNEARNEIQKKEGGNEEDSAGSSAKGFWNGA